MKYALLIGINYTDTDHALSGCWNDVKSMKKLLMKEGYQEKNIIIMTDEVKYKNTLFYPSGDNMMRQIRDFIKKAVPGDNLFFHYSGHGGQIPDYNGDERLNNSTPDDECIYSVDFETISDDRLREILVDQLTDGASLRCLMDCCHSGTGMDLPWIYSTNLVDRFNIFNMEQSEIKQCNQTLSTKDVISISGCRDSQYSADAWIDNLAQGALTAYFVKVCSKKVPGWRWKDLIKMLRWELSGYYEQVPQLTFTDKKAYKDPVTI